MIDLVRIVFVIGTLMASARAKLRIGIVLSLAVASIMAIEIALLSTLTKEAMPAELAFGAIFLGPTALAPIDPLHHLVAALLAALGARSAFAKSALLHPETERARVFDRAGLRFVGLAVLQALLSLSGLLGRALGR